MHILWIKSFHILSFVCWFAAIFYLPRLFVYHASTNDSMGYDRFIIMERKLMYGIAMPSMLATLISGGALLYLMPYYLKSGWLHVKLLLVVFTIIYHHICLIYMRHFKNKTNTKTHVFYRIFNEIPVLFLIGIIIMVVVQPF
jgi:putative membrane protein